MPDRHIAAVFFDLDETLIEHTLTPKDLVRTVYDAHTEVFNGVDNATFGQTLRRAANDMWHMMYDGVLQGEIARLYMFKNTLRELELDQSAAESMVDIFESVMLKSTKPYPDSHATLQALREGGMEIGIITNGFTAMQNKKIEHHGFVDCVDHILVSEAVGAHKPDPQIFHEALSRALVQANQAIHIGDHATNDIGGAIGAGLAAALYDPAGDRITALREAKRAVEPTHVITTLAEILKIAGLDEIEAVPE